MADVLLVFAGLVLLAVAASLTRIWQGPTAADRIMGAQIAGTGGIAIVLLIGFAGAARRRSTWPWSWRCSPPSRPWASSRRQAPTAPAIRRKTRRRNAPMMLADIATTALAGLGAVFFIGGTVGLLRFPDVHSRLHALTKADNLGLGLISLGLVLQADSVALALKVILVWLLAMLAAATVTQLIARTAMTEDDKRSARGNNAGAHP
jgi:multicomponent Na+:H+ antiporter subunit G